jgi:DMSO/TMAO reductase YedYZ molybdopterin-dependent catalytic subunit
MEVRMADRSLDRRRFVGAAAAFVGALPLAACNELSSSPWVTNVLDLAEGVTRRVQRLILTQAALAPEYNEADISKSFKPNGSTDPEDPEYQDLADGRFKDWRLAIDGLVERPQTLALDELRSLPSRTQITRHDCVEGWSCIGKWKGVQLATLVERAGLKSNARYLVFHCADTLGASLDASKYYESIGLEDAFHPQTILAYDMNDGPLTVAHGAPLRLRVERQLGYKMAKYLMRIEVVENFAGIQGGKGGYWEDRGYEWYAGI